MAEEEEQARQEQEEKERQEEEQQKERLLKAAEARKSEAVSEPEFCQADVEADFKLEMERMYMEREDKLSLQFNKAVHRARFDQKNVAPP